MHMEAIMHQLLTGPLFYLSLGVCIVGMIVRFYQYFTGLNWQLDRVAIQGLSHDGIQRRRPVYL